MSRRRFLVDPLPAEGPTWLPEGPSHHLVRVLRLAPGATVRLFDGHGAEVEARVLQIEGGRARVEPTGPVRKVTPGVRRVLVLAHLKPKAMDTALRMATEVGVSAFVIVGATRSLDRPPRLDRWSRLLDAALQQSGRTVRPDLAWAASLGEALDDLDAVDLHIALPGSARSPSPTGDAAILVGPEGGWTDAEVRLALERGATEVGLGPHVLRADTAAALAAGFLVG